MTEEASISDQDAAHTVLGCFSGLLIMTGIGNVYIAWVCTVLWRWTIVPAGYPPLTFAMALGLDAIVSLWTLRGIYKDAKPDLTMTLLTLFFTPTVTLVLVWFWLKVSAWL